MKKIIFLLFVILVLPLIDSIYVKFDSRLRVKYRNCSGCQREFFVYMCAQCDSESYCSSYCTTFDCSKSEYLTSSKKCQCNKCKMPSDYIPV